MRIALLSTIELTQAGRYRAFERLGGRYLIEWQIDTARSLGCTRIVCLAERDSDQLREIRKRAETVGLEFELASGNLQLVAMLSADQELVVIADGLVVDNERLVREIGEGRGVIAVPDDAGIAAGFERIDAWRAWGGILVARANIVAQLAEMPSDSDAVSLLLRMALQSGGKLIELPADVLTNGEWLLVRDRAALAEREQTLLDRSVEDSPWFAPGFAIAGRVARRLAPEGLARGPVVAFALGGGAMIAALGLAATAQTFAGLIVFFAGCAAFYCSQALARLRSRLRGAGSGVSENLVRNLLDLVLALLLAMPLTAANWPESLFLPIMLIGLLRLAEGMARSPWNMVWRDRTLLAILLLPASWFGLMQATIAGLCLFGLAFSLFFRRNLQITQA